MAEQSYNYIADMLAKMLKPKPQEAEHFEELGRFIAAFTQAEAQVHMFARWLSKTDDERARAIFANFKVSESIARIQALLLIGDKPKSLLVLRSDDLTPGDVAIVQAALQQFKVIAEVRNKLVHRTVRMEETGLQVSNIFTAKSLLNVDHNFIVTLPDLRAMKVDCGSIYLHLSAAMEPRRGDGLDGPSVLLPWHFNPPLHPQPSKPTGAQGSKGQKGKPTKSGERKR